MRIQDALDVSKNITNNQVMLAIIETSMNNMLAGNSWIQPFEDSGLCSSMHTEMLKIGMQTDLSGMMEKLVEYMEIDIDNIMQKKISNYLSRLNVIMFCPDDLEIIKGTPATRRKFLNIELSQFKKDYVFQLKEYNQVLKQRNEYLKQKNNAKFDKTYFSILTEKLVIKNIELVKIRYDFINKINNYLKDVFDKIAGFGNLEIKYKSFIHEQDLNKADLKDFIINKYNSMFMNELLQKTTLLGCHKDDFKMYLNDLDVTEFSSQGQQRLSILSLKLAEIEVFVKEKHTKPIILLDDIFSELDEIKKNNIIDYFKEDIQIFITTTDIKDINDELKAKSDIYVVDNGNFDKEE